MEFEDGQEQFIDEQEEQKESITDDVKDKRIEAVQSVPDDATPVFGINFTKSSDNKLYLTITGDGGIQKFYLIKMNDDKTFDQMADLMTPFINQLYDSFPGNNTQKETTEEKEAELFDENPDV
jgi:hypothetical protein